MTHSRNLSLQVVIEIENTTTLASTQLTFNQLAFRSSFETNSVDRPICNAAGREGNETDDNVIRPVNRWEEEFDSQWLMNSRGFVSLSTRATIKLVPEGDVSINPRRAVTSLRPSLSTRVILFGPVGKERRGETGR